MKKNKRFLLSLLTLSVTVSPLALLGCDQWNDKVEQIKQHTAKKIATEAAVQIPSFAWPPSSAGEYLAARVAIGHDDLETANKAFGRAIDSAPNDASVAYLVEHALPVAIGTGDNENALALSDEIADVKASASGQFALLLRLREDFGKKDWAKIVKDSTELRNDGFGQYIAPLTKVWMLAGQNKIDESLSALFKANQSYPSFRGLFALHRGLILDMAGRNMQAEKAYMDVLNTSFTLRNALVAADFFARQHNQQALDNIAQQIREKTGLPFSNDDLKTSFTGDAAIKNAEQGFATILFDLATVLQQEGSSRLGLLYARIAEPALPKQPMMNVLLGDIFMDMKDYPEARLFYQRVPKDNLFFAVTQLRLADSYAVEGDMKAALDTLKPLSEIAVLKRQVLTQMADLLRASKQFNEAIPYYTQIIDGIKEPKKNDWALFYARGICFESLDRWQEAENDLQFALKLNPDQPEVLNYLGYSWADQGKKLEQAYDYIARAHSQTPEEPYITDSLGWILYRMGYFNEAVPYLEESVQALPADAVINEHLGDIYWQVGREQEARFQWERALKNSEDASAEDKDKLKDKIANGIEKRKPASAPLPKTKDMAQSDAIPDFFPKELREHAPVTPQ